MRRIFAYIRVSTSDQNIDRQLASMNAQGVQKENIFIDYQSGKDFDRPQYKRLHRKLRSGDLLLVHSIDRLGRNYDEIIEQWRLICKEKKVDIKVLDMPLLDTTVSKDLLGTFISDLVLQLLSFVAQNERENNKIRQREGIIEAKKKGVTFGRPKKDLPEDFEMLITKWRIGEISIADIASLCKVSPATVRRRISSLM